MKEIKFRAWFSAEHHKKMVYNLGFDDDSFKSINNDDADLPCVWDKDVINDQGNYDATLNFEIMQYTGLKDKNGVEIYERDIVEFTNTDDNETWISKVYFDGGALCINTEGNGPLDCDYTAIGWVACSWIECEVIGNICEKAGGIDA